MWTGSGSVLTAGSQLQIKWNILGTWKPEAGEGDAHEKAEGRWLAFTASRNHASHDWSMGEVKWNRVEWDFWKGDLVKSCLLNSFGFVFLFCFRDFWRFLGLVVVFSTLLLTYSAFTSNSTPLRWFCSFFYTAIQQMSIYNKASCCYLK